MLSINTGLIEEEICDYRGCNPDSKKHHPIFCCLVTDDRYNNSGNKLKQIDIAYISATRLPLHMINCHRREPGYRVGVHCKPTSRLKEHAQLEYVIALDVKLAKKFKQKWRKKRKMKSRLLFGPLLALKYNVPIYCRDIEWTKQFLIDNT